MTERRRLMNVERFPMRHASCVGVLEDDCDGWVVLARDHGWLHGSYHSALADAEWTARNLGLPIRLKEIAS
jgi:hypothetical protein